MAVQEHKLDRSIASASPFREGVRDKPPGRQWDAEANDADELGPNKPRLGGRISKKDVEQYGERWRRLRKVDEGLKSWRPGDDLDAYADAEKSTTRDNRHGRKIKVHRVSTAADEVGVDSATENRARLLVAGVDAGQGHPVEKQVAGALVVARDEHVAERLVALAPKVDGPLGEELRRVSDTGPSERFRALNALATVADHETVHSVLSRRLTSLDSFTEWVDEVSGEAWSVKDAVENIQWGEAA